MENMLPQTSRTTTKQQSKFVSRFHDRDMKNSIAPLLQLVSKVWTIHLRVKQTFGE